MDKIRQASVSGMRFRGVNLCGLFIFISLVSASAAPASRSVDVLVIGGSESAVAAAVQAARQGVKKIALVHDTEWLGGQFSSEAVGAVDEYTFYRGRNVNFPRSGIFLEVMNRIREHNGATYGVSSPGNAITATDTIEPAAAARIFAELLAPYEKNGSGQVEQFWPYEPILVKKAGRRVTGVEFASPGSSMASLRIDALITIDASDWGDVIRLSGARYSAGPDLKSRFGEEHAPKGPLGTDRNEMNPITYDVVLREAGAPSIIQRPPGYDPRNYVGSNITTKAKFEKSRWPANVFVGRVPLFVDTAYPEGIYSGDGSVYTQRRLVDRYHNGLAPGTETILLNWPVQDYPLYDFPASVRDALEKTESGASLKNVVEMTYAQRQIVFEDAKRFTLGFVYFLQTDASEAAGSYPQTFRNMRLTPEFGTSDSMPPKPYVRESLRLEALYMLREQDIQSTFDVETVAKGGSGDIHWARVMPPDNVFGFQFNIDFHPTRRIFLDGATDGPWMCAHTANRNWATQTDRAGFPYRGLVPVEVDGLLGAGRNLGVSSIISSALRVHGQMMMAGQAAGSAAALALEKGVQPRAIATDWTMLRELQTRMVSGTYQHPGMILWPYQDVSTEDRWFEGANLLAVWGILPGFADSLDFQPWRIVKRRELAVAVARAYRSQAGAKPWNNTNQPVFSDVPNNAPGFREIQSLRAWGILPEGAAFHPDAPADLTTLYAMLKAAGWKVSEGLRMPAEGRRPVLNRQDLAIHLWLAVKDRPIHLPVKPGFLQPGQDSDGDGIPDLDDALPLDGNNNGILEWLDSSESKRL